MTDDQVRARVANIAAAGSHSKEVEEKARSCADLIYQTLAGDAALYGKAFFGHRKTPAERSKLNRLWRRAQRIAEAPCQR